jgi:hypothetical protein
MPEKEGGKGEKTIRVQKQNLSEEGRKEEKEENYLNQ